MAENLRGKGVIAGIAMGKVMIVGQNLDGYLANYKPESKDAEMEKVKTAVAAVAEILQGNIKTLQEREMPEQAAIMEAHRMMAQDPMMADSMVNKVNELGSAPEAVLAAAKENAATFEQMDDAYFRERAVDIRDVGKRIAKYILGVKEPELGDGAVVVDHAERAEILDLYRRADRVLFNSAWMLDLAQKQLMVELPNVGIFPHLVRFDWSESLPWTAAETPRLASVSRLDCHHKGLDVLLEAVEVAPELVPAVFYLHLSV